MTRKCLSHVARLITRDVSAVHSVGQENFKLKFIKNINNTTIFYELFVLDSNCVFFSAAGLSSLFERVKCYTER